MKHSHSSGAHYSALFGPPEQKQEGERLHFYLRQNYDHMNAF